ncbi:MAG TPA: NHL repeat-containing protein [Blastocatellia bacterium]|nr:NHL repeat-containing protein [Blastocatellia bacterium]
MRRIIFAVAILILPTATAVIVYLVVTKKVPTNRESIGRVVVIAGSGYAGTEDGLAGAASFSDPFGVALDRKGNLYVTDGGQSNRIRRISPEGKVDSIAGSTEGYAEGNALQAQFNTPSGIAIDRAGSILVADTSNNRIRKIAADGRVTTFAGNGNAGFKDGKADQAEFDGPIGIAVDKRGNVFVADTYNDRIRKISSDGNVITMAGTGSPGFSDGDASIAQLNTPAGVAIDDSGNIFVADTGNDAIRRISAKGEVSTIAGRSAETTGESAALRHPIGLAVTHDGFVFATEASRVIRIAPDGSAEAYAGGRQGFAEGAGARARFSGPAGIAIDREGNLFVADALNYLIRQITPDATGSAEAAPIAALPVFIQPGAEAVESDPRPLVPRFDLSKVLSPQSPFPWPLSPQDEAHEITGVVGEARGAPGGIALDHLHSGLDIRGDQGEPVLSVLDEKVSSPIANWDFGGGGEGIQIGLMSYIHTRIGRNSRDEIQAPEKFKAVLGIEGKISGVRVRRGTRFRVGDFIGTVNRLYHVHLNLGPWNAQANPLALPFAHLRDTTPPTVEPNGIEIVNAAGLPFSQRVNGRVLISGDVRVLLRAYDRVDGNAAKRKLGLFRAGYQLIREDGVPVKGFEQPLINIEFNRLPPDDSSVRLVYAAGSGVSAYGTPTEFKYIVTNRVRDGEAREGFLRTSDLPPGNYVIRAFAEDYAGNRASDKPTEMAIAVTR